MQNMKFEIGMKKSLMNMVCMVYVIEIVYVIESVYVWMNIFWKLSQNDVWDGWQIEKSVGPNVGRFAGLTRFWTCSQTWSLVQKMIHLLVRLRNGASLLGMKKHWNMQFTDATWWNELKMDLGGQLTLVNWIDQKVNSWQKKSIVDQKLTIIKISQKWNICNEHG